MSIGNWENGEIMFASFDFDDFWLFGIFFAMGLRSCESGEGCGDVGSVGGVQGKRSGLDSLLLCSL